MRGLIVLLLACVGLAGCQPEAQFKATQLVDTPEDRARLTWNVVPNRVTAAPITKVVIEPDVGEVGLSGEVIVVPDETTEYTLRAVSEAEGFTWNTRLRATVHVGDRLSDLDIVDANLRACLADSGKTHVAQVEFLNCVQRDIVDVSGIEALEELDILNIDQNLISDISPLMQLPQLQTLNIGDNLIEDLSPMAGNQTLNTFSAYGNEISDLSPLQNVDHLKVLALDNNDVMDVTPLQSLADLGILTLSRNEIEDVSPLSVLSNLLVLDLSNNEVNEGVLDLQDLESANLIRLDGNGDVRCITYLQLLLKLPVVTFTDCRLF